MNFTLMRVRGDVHTTSRGVGSKVDVVREVAWIICCISVPNADKRGRGQKTRNLFGRHMYMPPRERLVTDNNVSTGVCRIVCAT